MNKLHRSQCDISVIEPNEGQHGLLCSNEVSLCCPSLSSSSNLSIDTLGSLEELGDILKSIHKRMTQEGYKIIDGSIQRSH